MRTILLVLDAIDPSQQAILFAFYLAAQSDSVIHAVFLENPHMIERAIQKDLHNRAILYRTDEHAVTDLNVKAGAENNIRLFKSNCDAKGIPFNIHRSSDSTGREIAALGRFADFVVVDVSTSMERHKEVIPGKFIQDMLEHSLCPVILAPEHFQEIEKLVFAYDGSDSSLFAIKQFSYLFPQFHNRNLIILYVHPDGEWMQQEKADLTRWLSNYYTNYSFEELEGEPRDRLFEYLFKKENLFLVMGAYGRNSISRFFRQSQANPLIKTITQPVFISHT